MINKNNNILFFQIYSWYLYRAGLLNRNNNTLHNGILQKKLKVHESCKKVQNASVKFKKDILFIFNKFNINFNTISFLKYIIIAVLKNENNK